MLNKLKNNINILLQSERGVVPVRKLISSFKRHKQPTFVITSLLILVLLSISPAAASVSNWDFSPQNPVSGDTLSIKGSASPGEKTDLFVNFENTVTVSGGEFEYVLEDVKIPEGLKNSFKVEAIGAKNLNVRVKMVIWITKSSEASGNTATVSQSDVPPGTYTIRIDGDAGEEVSEVNLKITAFQEIEADSNGDFSYSYNTKSVPPGNFEINVGGKAKEINVQPKGTFGSTSGSTLGSTSGSTQGSTLGSTSGSTQGSTSGSTQGSTSGSTQGSTSGSTQGSTSGSTQGSTSGSNSTESSSGETEKTTNQLHKTSDSISVSSTAGSSPVKTGSPLEPGDSKNLEGKVVSGTSNSNKDVEEKDTQKQPSGGSNKTSGSSQPSVDIFYLLVGIGAGILILAMYLLKK